MRGRFGIIAVRNSLEDHERIKGRDVAVAAHQYRSPVRAYSTARLVVAGGRGPALKCSK